MLPAAQSLPCISGIGLRAPHYREVLQDLPALGWVELHSENFFGGGAALHTLLKVREHYPVSLHGVGLGLASPDPLDREHITALRQLCDTVQPACVSEHLCWNRISGQVINDLLPFPYTEAALQHVVACVQQLQDALARPVLIENLSSYLDFPQSTMSEAEFLAALSQQTGCGILFDINNLYVNACNLGVDAQAFIRALPAQAVGEYHLAGHSLQGDYRIDTHSSPVCAEVWQLYQLALEQIGPRPTLIEWDNEIPALSVLMHEAAQAQQHMAHAYACLA